MTPEHVTGLKGRVVQGPYGLGSKSERTAVFLVTQAGDHKYLLRRKTGPTYGDEVVAALEGKTVVCDGFILGGTLMAEDIREV
ncbi:MAG: hypothetical protein WAW39_18450 [Prosthecobacter sp.]|uniref:hypothetical protein n=1 Tax=Prosthecobacter sp. TaxID=1965333 RepID=UPI003BAEA6EA